ncbi:MAG TPA: hypothetical protein VFP50_01005 [Anaeromyxobacteraceae bacterium]|nr:hypothetical protein [Anaeromyxobacteraceae bacterium]
MTQHIDASELLQRLVGQLTEHRAAEVRAHLTDCPSCQAEQRAQLTLVDYLAAPIEEFPSADLQTRLEARIDQDATSGSDRRTRRSGRWALAASGVAALAAAVALVAVPALRAARQEVFLARGATTAWADRIGVELHLVTDPPRRLDPGTVLSPSAGLMGSYRNLGAAPAYLLAFAIDARGEVHWLYPAYTTPGTDPESVRLQGQTAGAAFADSVELERPAAGPLRCVFVVTQAPLHVSAVEALPPAERAPERLRERWPDAAVSTLDLVVAEGSRP